MRFHYPVRAGNEWVVSITPIYLSSGDAPSAVYAGHYFRYINDSSAKQRDLTDSLTVYEPEIRYRTEDAPHYHNVDDSAALLNSAAQTDLSGEYEGEKKSTVGLNLKLKAVKLINDNFGIGAYVQENKSADFNEFSIGFVFQYYFRPMKTLSHTWDTFQRME